MGYGSLRTSLSCPLLCWQRGIPGLKVLGSGQDRELWSLWNPQHLTACGLLVSDPLGEAGHTPRLGMAGPCHSFFFFSFLFFLIVKIFFNSQSRCHH